MKYRKKPVEIEAVKWTGGNHREMFDFLTYDMYKDKFISACGVNFYIDHNKVEGGLVIKTLEGEHLASIGDYIIKGIAGEFYPCKPDIFKKTYELADHFPDTKKMAEGDLISREEVVEVPTAYDVDKVLELVEEYRSEIGDVTTDILEVIKYGGVE